MPDGNPVDTITYSPNVSKPVLLGPYRDNIGSNKIVNGTDTKAWAHPIFQNLTAELRQLRWRRGLRATCREQSRAPGPPSHPLK